MNSIPTRSRAAVAALVLSAACATAAAQAPPVEHVAIDIVGPQQIDAEHVRVRIGVQSGQPLDRSALSRDVKALLDTGRFSQVHAAIEPTDGGGVRVIYAVEPKLKLAEPVHIEGEDRFRKSRVRDLLGLQVGALIDEQALHVAGRKLLKAYREDYFPEASLDWDMQAVDPEAGLAEVTLTIDEGDRARVRKFVFSGNEAVPRKALRKVIRRREPWDPRWLFRKKRYTDAELEGVRQALNSYYLDRGYLDARVAFPEINPAEKGLNIQIPIEEGPAYRFGGVSLEGVTIFPEQTIRELIELEPGAAAAHSRIETMQQRIRDFYTSRGYLDTIVRYSLAPHADDRTVDVRYHVTEGSLTYIRNIEIRGNTRTRDKVIRRELMVYPGDVFNQVKVRTSERILQNLRYFSSVRSFPRATALPAQKDLVFEVEETTTGNFMIGAGFSSIDNLIGFAEISQGNFDILGWPRFTGGGQKLKLRTQIADKRAQYELSFVEPWFLDRKLSLGVDLFHNEDRAADYDIERTGGAVSLSQPLPGPNRISYRYRFERLSEISDETPYFFAESDPDNPEVVSFFEPEAQRSSFRIALTHDTRNRPFIPDRGLRAVAYGEITGGPLGCDTDFYELGAELTQYVPLWFEHVLILRARYATVDPFGDTETVPYADRMFLGGGRTVRGFGYRDIGPKVEPLEDGSIVRSYGGNSMAMASINYTIPVVQGIRLATFYDVGNVWRDAFDFDPSGMAAGAGVGVRFDVPGFPIRLDRAWVVEKDDPRTDEDAWVIWIGYDI